MLKILARTILTITPRPGAAILGLCGCMPSMATLAMDTPPLFMDETFTRGLFFQHVQRGETLRGLMDVFGAGVCAFDFDNDGDMDLLFAGGVGQTRFYGEKSWWTQIATSRLFENNGAGYFTDITANSGIKANLNSMGCAYGDFDQDGLTDFIISSTTQDYLYKNNLHRKYNPLKKLDYSPCSPSGSVSDCSTRNALLSRLRGNDEHEISGEPNKSLFIPQPLGKQSRWTTGITPVDINQDGLLDLYITGYLDFDHTAKHLESNSGFASPDKPQFKPENYSGISNSLLINTGNLGFREMATELAAADTDGRSIQAMPLYLDDDNKSDLLVINGKGSKPKVLLNRHPNPFVSGDKIIAPPLNTLSVTGQYLYDDLSPSLLFGAPSGKIKSIYKKQRLDARLRGYDEERDGHEAGNSRWADKAWSTITGPETLLAFSTPSILAQDFNSDGETDIYLGNGLFAYDADAPEVATAQPDLLLLGQNGHFMPTPIPGIAATSARGLISVDIDNDGDRDILSSSNNDFPLLLVNQSNPENWIGLSLTDQWGNPGHYRQVRITTDKKTRFFAPSSPGFLSQGDHRITLTLSKGEVIQEIRVIWHDGSESNIKNLGSNQYLVLRQNHPKKSSDLEKLDSRLRGNGERKQTSDTAANRSFFKLKWRWLLQDDDLPLLSAAFNSWDKQEKIAFIQFVGQQPYRHPSLAVLQKALAEKDPDIVTAAIAATQSLESEASYRLLSPRLNDNTPTRLLCKTAEAIEHFFTKEEAVIARKNLFTTDMLAILEKTDNRAKVCLITALAQSKSYRATRPLERLLTDNDKRVQLAAAYALGELKYRQSLAAIQGLSAELSTTEMLATTAMDKITASNLKEIVFNSSSFKVKQNLRDEKPTDLTCKGLQTNTTVLVNLCTEASIANSLARQPLSARQFKALLENTAIANEKYAVILNDYLGSYGMAAGDYLIRIVKDGLTSDVRLSLLIQALDKTDQQNLALDIIKQVYTDKDQSPAVKIAAGDYLITRDKPFMKNHWNNF